VQGLPVLGTRSNLQQVCRDHDIEVLLITANISRRCRQAAIDAAAALDIECRELRVEFDALDQTSEERPSIPVSM